MDGIVQDTTLSDSSKLEGEPMPRKRGRKVNGWRTKKATEGLLSKRKRNAQQASSIQKKSSTEGLEGTDSNGEQANDSTFSLYMQYVFHSLSVAIFFRVSNTYPCFNSRLRWLKWFKSPGRAGMVPLTLESDEDEELLDIPLLHSAGASERRRDLTGTYLYKTTCCMRHAEDDLWWTSMYTVSTAWFFILCTWAICVYACCFF